MRARRLRLAAVPWLAAGLAAQQIVCDPAQATLRPGESTCAVVSTAPVAQGILVQPSFDPGAVALNPSGAVSTDASGRARFVVSPAGTRLNGTAITFTALSGGYGSCAMQVVCDLPELVLRGQAGSFPGQLAAELVAAQPLNPSAFAAILLSPGPGPLPLFVLNPGDPRALALGAIGLTSLPGHAGPLPPPYTRFAPPPIAVPTLGARAVLYAQGLTIDAALSPRFNRISQPAPIAFAPARSSWNRGAALLTPRSFFPVVFDRLGRPVVAGGGQGAIFAQVATRLAEVYDPVAGAFVPNAFDMTTERSLHTATRLQNGKWLLAGGVDVQNDPTDAAEIYDPTTDAFTAVGRMAVKRMGHTATLLTDGRVLIAGGINVVSTDIATTINSTQATTEYFTLDSTGCNGTFAPGPNMTRPRAGHVVQPLGDGRLHFLGGVGYTVLIIFRVPAIWTETEFFSGTSFISGPSMPTPRAIFALTQIGTNPDRYLAAGGLSDLLANGAPTAAADVYTASPNAPGAWTRAGNMAQPRGMQAAVRFGNQVLQFGGLQGDLSAPFALASTEVYDVAGGAWSVGPALSVERGAYGSYLDAWGIVHLIGGAIGSGQSPPVGTSTDWFFP